MPPIATRAPPDTRYRVRFAEGQHDVAAVMSLRRAAFPADAAGRAGDDVDAASRHLLVEGQGQPVATMRITVMRGADAFARGHAARVYGLEALAARPATVVELGRVCMDPALGHPDALRMAWAALAGIVDAEDARMLIGCTSFAGTDPTIHAGAFRRLRARHMGPVALRPERIAAETVGFDTLPPGPTGHVSTLPPLLRSYLGMGGWVGDHAVVDRDMGTTHVFTALDVANIPPARALAFRNLARERMHGGDFD